MADKSEKKAIIIIALLLTGFVFLRMHTGAHLIKPLQSFNGNKIRYIKQTPHKFALPNYLPLSSQKGYITYFIYFGINIVLLVALLYIAKFKEMGKSENRKTGIKN